MSISHFDRLSSFPFIFAGFIIGQAFVTNIWDCICSTGHSNLGDWNDVFVTHLIIIIKSEVSIFPIVVMLFHDCVSEQVVPSYFVIHYIYIYIYMIGCIMTCRLRSLCLQITPSHYHHYADLPKSIELLKCLSGICCQVCVKSQSFPSIIFYSIYDVVCLQLTRFSCDDSDHGYFILLPTSNRKYESSTIV